MGAWKWICTRPGEPFTLALALAARGEWDAVGVRATMRARCDSDQMGMISSPIQNLPRTTAEVITSHDFLPLVLLGLLCARQ